MINILLLLCLSANASQTIPINPSEPQDRNMVQTIQQQLNNAFSVNGGTVTGNSWFNGIVSIQSKTTSIIPANNNGNLMFQVGNGTVTVLSNGNVGVSTSAPIGTFVVNGSSYFSGSGSPSVGEALCLTAAGKLGHCTSLVLSTGACTCNTP